MGDTYSPREIAEALRGETDDAEAILDVELAFPRLSRLHQQVLTDYANGYTPQEAGQRAGAKNGRRLYDEAIRRLANLANGTDIS